MEYAARIAPEVDRLVLAVNREAGSTIREETAARSDELGLDTPALLPHYAEFLLAGALTPQLAVVRLPYLPPEEVIERVGVWRRMGLVTGPPEALRATSGLAELLDAIQNARAAVARALWSDAPSFEPARDLLTGVVDGIPERFRLATAHRALPAPPDPFLALHRRLTTVRYVRSQAHVEAWKAQELTRGQIVAMTALWHEERTPDDAALRALVERGLAFADGSGLTVEGARLRQRIEADTNAATRPVFETLDDDDRENLLVSLAQLPGHP